MATFAKITTNLWFDDQAEEAARFYTRIFENSRMGGISRYGKEGFEIHGKPEGTALTVEFELEGQPFVALNGGPQFRFNESISFIIHCESQEEVDYFWEKLTAGGDPAAQQCGWLKDKFGLSWQVVPRAVGQMLTDPDPVKTGRVMKVLLPMKKLDLALLTRAYHGEGEG